MSLAACTTDGEGVDPIGFLSSKRAPARISVTSDRISIAGPAGFCIDTGETRDDANDAFVLLGSCASISGSARAAAPATPALLTASVAVGQDPAISVEQSVSVLPAFFRSEAGRSALSRSGDPSRVEVLETMVHGDMFVLHARDRSENTLAGVEDDYWRALFDLKGALVTISVLSFGEQPISTAEARRLLVAFGQSVRAANSSTSPAPPAFGTQLVSLFRGGAR